MRRTGTREFDMSGATGRIVAMDALADPDRLATLAS